MDRRDRGSERSAASAGAEKAMSGSKTQKLSIAILFALIASVLIGVSCGAGPDALPRAERAEVNKTNESDKKNLYFALRDHGLNISAEELGLELSKDRVQVLGVVVDIVTEDGSATFTAFRNGDASMYTSDGGGVIGGILHEGVRRAAIAMVERAESRIAAFAPTDDTPLPPAGHARFYLVTGRGRYFADETVDALFFATGTLPDLTAAANDLFTELRVLDETMQRGDQ